MAMVMIDVREIDSPEAADTTIVYAVGDVHGRLDLLTEMERLIAADIAAVRPVQPAICYLGDYIDRGPSSAQVIDHLAAPGVEGVHRIFLKGNHEDRMIDFLVDPVRHGPGWAKFGGREALESYGIHVPAEPDEAGWWSLRDALDRALPESHRTFVKQLRLAFVWRDYFFVHAGLDPNMPVHSQSTHDLMWIREPFLSADTAWPFRVVHGHVIVPEPEFRPNRIGIDTGAYQSGRLTCLVVDAGGTRLLHT